MARSGARARPCARGTAMPETPLPLDALHRRLGARMVPFAGHAMPLHYEGIVAEHRWTRLHASLFDVSHMGQLRLAGEGAAAFLETLAPGDFIGLRPGRMRYSLLLAEDGGILDDLMVTHMGDHLHLVVNGATKHADIAHIARHLPRGLELSHAETACLLALQGPEAAAALSALPLEPLVPGGPGVSGLRFLEAAPFLWEGARLVIHRSGYTGEDGFEITVPAGRATDLAEALLARPEVRPAGLGARDSLRLEAGLPLYGDDLSPETEPVEAGLAFAISKRRKMEGGFPGAGRILSILLEGPARRRVGLRLEGRQPARKGALILAGETPVGCVTSGGWSPTLEAAIAMGYVASGSAADHTPLAIEVRGRRLPAVVVPLPFVPHRTIR